MARITRVKKAQQRYKTVPVLDEDGNPKRTPVMRRDGSQKTTKSGRQVYMTVTKADKSQPLPELRCDYPGCDINGGKIAVGTPYKHITPKSGPFGGTQKNRHAEHPDWNLWEYSSSLSARVAEIEHNADFSEVENEDDVQAVLDNMAEEIRGLAEEKRESASNIEDGFGHSTSASEELEEIAQQLDDWADEVEQTEIPELPEPEERYFVKDPNGNTICEEQGYEDESEAQDALDDYLDDTEDEVDEDSYEVVAETPDEPSDEQIDEWRDEVENMDIPECPV